MADKGEMGGRTDKIHKGDKEVQSFRYKIRKTQECNGQRRE